jgi:type I restriction enzyme S subunit
MTMIKPWPTVRLGAVLTPTERGETVDASKEYRLLGIRLDGQGPFLRETVMGTQTSATKLFRVATDDFIYSRLFACRGAFGVISKELDGCFVSGEFPKFVPVKGKIDVEFLKYWFRLPSVIEAVDEDCSGSTPLTRNRFKENFFLALEIPLPPLAEQRRVVSRIEELAAQIHEARTLRLQVAEETEALVASETNSLFTDNEMLRWPTKSLEEVAEIRSGVTLGRRLTGRMVRLPYLRVANVQDGHLDLAKMKEVDVLESEADKWKLQRGDLLLTEGGDWDKLGRGTVWREEIPNCIHQNHIFRVRTKADEFVPEFVSRLISSPVGKAYFQEASKQTTNLASINQRQLKAFRVFQPPLPEQRRIVSELDALQAEVDALKELQRQTSEELDALLPSILDRAFKGEL